MSIAVLRTFVAKRKEEYEELINKRNNKSHKKDNQVETPVVNGDTALTSQHDEIGVVHEKETNQATNEIGDLSKEETKTPSRKVTRELKPPIVLEVRLLVQMRHIVSLSARSLDHSDIQSIIYSHINTT